MNFGIAPRVKVRGKDDYWRGADPLGKGRKILQKGGDCERGGNSRMTKGICCL